MLEIVNYLLTINYLIYLINTTNLSQYENKKKKYFLSIKLDV